MGIETVYSFSRISAYQQCPYGYYKKYIEHCPGIENFYAQAGSFMHELLEQIISSQITIEDAIERFVEDFDVVCDMEVASQIRDRIFEKMVTYLADLDEHTLDGYEVLGVEKEVFFNVGAYRFRGFIDLLLRDSDGNIVMVDHKSSTYPLGKTGKVLKNKEQEFLQYKRQQYLYSIAVKDEYGVNPVRLEWNHFKESKICSIIFNEDELQKAKEWAESMVETILADEVFVAQKDFFFCHNLCEYREGDCEYLLEEDEIE